MKGRAPGEVILRPPEWKQLWYDSPDDQYGHPPALSRADSEAIECIVNQAHYGHARYLQIKGRGSTGAGKLQVANDSLPFLDRDQLIDRNVLELLDGSARPANLQQLNFVGASKPKVDAQVIL